MSMTKDALLEAYNVAVAENGETSPVVSKIRFVINQHFPEIRDVVNRPTIYNTPVVDTREEVDFSAYFKKKVSETPLATVVEQSEIVPDEPTTPTAFSSESLKEMATKSAEELLKEQGIEKIRAAATALGYKISHSMAHLKFAEKFIEALNTSITA